MPSRARTQLRRGGSSARPAGTGSKGCAGIPDESPGAGTTGAGTMGAPGRRVAQPKPPGWLSDQAAHRHGTRASGMGEETETSRTRGDVITEEAQMRECPPPCPSHLRVTARPLGWRRALLPPTQSLSSPRRQQLAAQEALRPRSHRVGCAGPKSREGGQRTGVTGWVCRVCHKEARGTAAHPDSHRVSRADIAESREHPAHAQ